MLTKVAQIAQLSVGDLESDGDVEERVAVGLAASLPDMHVAAGVAGGANGLLPAGRPQGQRELWAIQAI